METARDLDNSCARASDWSSDATLDDDLSVRMGTPTLTGISGYTFSAVRGIQAGHEYFVAMCPLRLMPRLFPDEEGESRADRRAQRPLNKGRIPAIREYLLKNPMEYVFPAITVSVDGDVDFTPASPNMRHYNVGALTIPTTARLVINDGQHRRAAIIAALKARPGLGDETIATVFLMDRGLARSQQLFADLNRFSVRPAPSLAVLYDHRDPLAGTTCGLLDLVDVFRSLTETNRSSIGVGSPHLFTLSAIYRGTVELLRDHRDLAQERQTALATGFWNAVATHIAEWGQALVGEVSAATLRRDYVHAHAVALVALGRAGRALLAHHPRDWRQRLVQLELLDWRRENAELWEGRGVIGGQISAAAGSVTLLTSVIKQALDLPLTEEEQAAEAAYAASKRLHRRGEDA